MATTSISNSTISGSRRHHPNFSIATSISIEMRLLVALLQSLLALLLGLGQPWQPSLKTPGPSLVVPRLQADLTLVRVVA